MKHKLTTLILLASTLVGGLFAEGASHAGSPAVSPAPESSGELFSEVAPDVRMVLELRNFYGRLRSEYGYEPMGEPISNFEEGAPALTRESVRLALQGPLAAARSLRESIDGLSAMIEDLEAGRLDRDSFKRDFTDHLERVGLLARSVEKDEYLRLIDLRPDQKPSAFETSQSGESLHSRVAELARVAKQMEASLMADSRDDTTQVVSVQSLLQPSFRTLCQGIERLAVSLRSSIEGL